MPVDPLSLFFLGCALFAALFIVASMLLGGHGAHGHIGHVGHVGHLAAGHAVGHVVGHATGQAAHTGHVGHATQGGQQAPGEVAVSSSVWASAQNALLGALNINGILFFLLIFGLLGYLLRAGGFIAWLAVLIAAPVGFVGSLAINIALARLFFENEAGELSARSSQIEGRLGTISIAIRPDGIGEVIFTSEAGARQSMGARAEDRAAAIAKGTEVVVTSLEQGIATVKPWVTFLAEVKAPLQSQALPEPHGPSLSD